MHCLLSFTSVDMVIYYVVAYTTQSLPGSYWGSLKKTHRNFAIQGYLPKLIEEFR
jgi:hypothetical protein